MRLSGATGETDDWGNQAMMQRKSAGRQTALGMSVKDSAS